MVEGFEYVPEVVSEADEEALIHEISALTLTPVVMRGYTAKRKTAHFGVVYGYDRSGLTPGPPMPPFLTHLRDCACEAAGLDVGVRGTLTEALVTEYVAGATIGWHRDAPQFGPIVVGISLGAPCRMRFRRIAAPGGAAPERSSIILAPRSLYVLSGAARSAWQHSVPAVAATRYSITYRSVRSRTLG